MPPSTSLHESSPALVPFELATATNLVSPSALSRLPRPRTPSPSRPRLQVVPLGITQYHYPRPGNELDVSLHSCRRPAATTTNTAAHLPAEPPATPLPPPQATPPSDCLSPTTSEYVTMVSVPEVKRSTSLARHNTAAQSGRTPVSRTESVKTTRSQMHVTDNNNNGANNAATTLSAVSQGHDLRKRSSSIDINDVVSRTIEQEGQNHAAAAIFRLLSTNVPDFWTTTLADCGDVPTTMLTSPSDERRRKSDGVGEHFREKESTTHCDTVNKVELPNNKSVPVSRNESSAVLNHVAGGTVTSDDHKQWDLLRGPGSLHAGQFESAARIDPASSTLTHSMASVSATDEINTNMMAQTNKDWAQIESRGAVPLVRPMSTAQTEARPSNFNTTRIVPHASQWDSGLVELADTSVSMSGRIQDQMQRDMVWEAQRKRLVDAEIARRQLGLYNMDEPPGQPGGAISTITSRPVARGEPASAAPPPLPPRPEVSGPIRPPLPPKISSNEVETLAIVPPPVPKKEPLHYQQHQQHQQQPRPHQTFTASIPFRPVIHSHGASTPFPPPQRSDVPTALVLGPERLRKQQEQQQQQQQQQQYQKQQGTPQPGISRVSSEPHAHSPFIAPPRPASIAVNKNAPLPPLPPRPPSTKPQQSQLQHHVGHPLSSNPVNNNNDNGDNSVPPFAPPYPSSPPTSSTQTAPSSNSPTARRATHSGDSRITLSTSTPYPVENVMMPDFSLLTSYTAADSHSHHLPHQRQQHPHARRVTLGAHDSHAGHEDVHTSAINSSRRGAGHEHGSGGPRGMDMSGSGGVINEFLRRGKHNIATMTSSPNLNNMYRGEINSGGSRTLRRSSRGEGGRERDQETNHDRRWYGGRRYSGGNGK